MDCGGGQGNPGLFPANSKANEASYVFIAAIIAGMPIIFMTRGVML